MESKVSDGNEVTIDCVGTLENGMVFTNTQDDGPIKFKVGAEEVISGLNDAVVGMSAGEEKDLTVNPEEGFGAYDDNLLIELSTEKLPDNAEKGMQLKSADENGNEMIWTVKELHPAEQKAVLDGNHVLAGETLNFSIKIKEVV